MTRIFMDRSVVCFPDFRPIIIAPEKRAEICIFLLAENTPQLTAYDILSVVTPPPMLDLIPSPMSTPLDLEPEVFDLPSSFPHLRPVLNLKWPSAMPIFEFDAETLPRKPRVSFATLLGTDITYVNRAVTQLAYFGAFTVYVESFRALQQCSREYCIAADCTGARPTDHTPKRQSPGGSITG